MKTATAILVVAVSMLAGCVGIPKPDWNPGYTRPAPQTEKEAKETCKLPSKWGWSKEHKKWVCAYTPPVIYYGPVHYYGPPFPHVPVYPPALCCYNGYGPVRRDGK